jgi:diguanylate cyclase (GGDEF)-like protein
VLIYRQFQVEVILLVLSLAGIAGPAMLMAFERALPRKVDGLRHVTKGSALMMLSCFALSIGRQVSNSPSDHHAMLIATYIGCLLLVGSCAYWYEGCRRLAEVPGDARVARAALAVYSIGLGGFTFLAKSDVAVLAYNAIACAASLGACSIVISHGSVKRRIKKAIGLVFLIGVALFSAQAVGLIQYGFGQLRVSPQLGTVLVIGIYFTAQAAMIGFAALASERVSSQFEREATIDFLTGLLVRKEFIRRAEREIARCSREKVTVACLMIDIDNFKAINDEFGHQKGDRVIADFAFKLDSSCRLYDLAGRYGGDEFIAFLPGAAPHDARVIAERIRDSAQQKRPGTLPEYAVSIGVCCASSVSLQDLVTHADKALYRAKQDGRNKVCVEPILQSQAVPVGMGFSSGGPSLVSCVP